jgi:SAM-dependent methyltransferase
MTVGQTQYIALDILEKNKDYAVEFYGFKPRNFIVRDLHGFDFTYDDGARIKFVDLVLLWNTFCYFNSLQISEILDEIKKALSPNGQLIICEPWETKERFAIRGFDHCTFRPPSYYNTVWRDHGLVVLHFKDYPSRDFKDSKGKVFETGSSRVWLIQP